MRKATKKVLSVMLAVSLAVPNGLFAGKVYAETNSNLASSNVQADKRRDLSELTAMGITYDKEYSYTIEKEEKKGVAITKVDTNVEGVVDLSGFDITVIAQEAFKSCSKITKVILPDTVIDICGWAFMDCSALSELNIPNSVESIDLGTFCRCSSLKELNIPASLKKFVISYGNGNSFEKITVDKDNKVYDSRNNCNAIIETKSNTLVYGCMNSVIPNDIVYIGDFSFDSCENVKNITIPNSVKEIGEAAFRWTDISEINIPEGVEALREIAFGGCENLKEIVIPSSVKEIERVAIPAGAEKISVDKNNKVYDSRNDCNAIIRTEYNELILACTNTLVPDSVVSIGLDAFDCVGNGGSKAKSIKLPSSVKRLGNYAISVGEQLEIIIMEGVTELDSQVVDDRYDNTQKKLKIKLPATLTKIDKHAFTCDGYEDKDIGKDRVIFYAPENSYAYNYYKDRGYTVLSDEGVDLTVDEPTPSTKTLSDCVTYDENYSYTIDGVEKKGVALTKFDTDFEGVVDLSESNIAAIAPEAFKSCSKITKIILPDTVELIDFNAFLACGAKEIIVPKSVKKIVVPYVHNDSFEKIVVAEGNEVYDSRNDCNAIVETKSNKLIYGCKNSSIPEGITAIGDEAFNGCSYFENLNLPNSVKEIGDYAFSWTGIAELNLPEGVEKLGRGAFNACIRIESIVVPASVKEISEFAFPASAKKISVSKDNKIFDSRNNCNAIIRTSNNELIMAFESTVIPDGIESIGSYAYDSNNNIKSIKLPASVKIVKTSAISSSRELESIIIDGATTLEKGAINDWNGRTKEEPIIIKLPATLTSIDEHAITREEYNNDGSFKEYDIPKNRVTFYAPENSYAYNYYKAKGYNIVADGRVEPTENENSNTTPSVESNSTTTESTTSAGGNVSTPNNGQTNAAATTDTNTTSSNANNNANTKSSATESKKVVAPSKEKIVSLRSLSGKKFKLKFKRLNDVKGYEISYSRNRSFRNRSTSKKITTNASVKITCSRAGAYYVRVRAYNVDANGKKVYGKYSTVKRVTVR